MPRARSTPVSTTLLTLSETDQWKADPSRNPAPSPTPNSRASGTAARRPMIGPTAIHAIRLSTPSRSQEPTATSMYLFAVLSKRLSGRRRGGPGEAGTASPVSGDNPVSGDKPVEWLHPGGVHDVM